MPFLFGHWNIRCFKRLHVLPLMTCESLFQPFRSSVLHFWHISAWKDECVSVMPMVSGNKAIQVFNSFVDCVEVWVIPESVGIEQHCLELSVDFFYCLLTCIFPFFQQLSFNVLFNSIYAFIGKGISCVFSLLYLLCNLISILWHKSLEEPKRFCKWFI